MSSAKRPVEGGEKITFALGEAAATKQAPRQLIETGPDISSSSQLYWKRIELFISLSIRGPMSTALSVFAAINSSCFFGSDSAMAADVFKTDSVS